jgi:hypothetical protein
MLSRSDLQKIDEVRVDGELCAMILPACYDKPGIQFFTRGELSQQLASMSYPAGTIIPSHTHNPVRREVFYTQEALFIRKGSVRVDYAGETDKTRFAAVLPVKLKFD